MCGYIIHLCGGLTTLRKSGGTYRFLIFFFSYGLVIFLNLSGMPGFVGFFFKELFLSQCLTSQFLLSFVLISFCLSFGLTCFYLYKLFYFTLFSYPKGGHAIYAQTENFTSFAAANCVYLYTRSTFTLNSILTYFYLWHCLFFIGNFLLYYYFSCSGDFYFFYYSMPRVNFFTALCACQAQVTLMQMNQFYLFCFWTACALFDLSVILACNKFYHGRYTYVQNFQLACLLYCLILFFSACCGVILVNPLILPWGKVFFVCYEIVLIKFVCEFD
jgi:hypothetical protein